MRQSFLTRRVTNGARVGDDGNRDHGQLRNRRNDELEAVRQSAPFEIRKAVFAGRSGDRATRRLAYRRRHCDSAAALVPTSSPGASSLGT